MSDRYGRVLASIAALLVAGGLVSLHTAVALHQGLVAGALLATVFIYDALFRNPPVSPTDPTAVVAVLLWHAILGWLLLVGFF